VALHDFAAFHAHDDPDARTTLRRFVTYLRDYVDGWHHHKEEDLLFIAMERAGFSHLSGPLACMHLDHAAGREHVAMIAELTGPRGGLDEEELAVLGRAVLGYVRLLTGHIAKENEMLYPMALRRIPARALDELDLAAARLDPAPGRQLEALGDELVVRYAAARLAAT
jgi:hemerythrin-like domain-containing protein